MTDASHVRNAIARFDQVRGVSDDARELAFANIKKAAKHYGVDMTEKGWKELGRRPSTSRPASARKESARKAATTRARRGSGTTPARKRGAVRAVATRKKIAGARRSRAKRVR
jgi:hypothetical protein